MRKHGLLAYEAKHHPVLTPHEFLVRMARSFLLVSGLIGVSLFGGMCGYHFLEGLPWIDAFLNAAMILSGMGPVAQIQTFAGKLFAGCYALYSGLVVIVVAGVIFAPALHRILHKFHADDDKDA